MFCTGTEESSQRSWCCPIDILSDNLLDLRLRQRFTILQKFRSKVMRFEVVKEQFERVEVLAFGKQELDCYVTRVEYGLRFWAVMLASGCDARPLRPKRSQISVSPPSTCSTASLATRSISFVSAFLSDKSQCTTPLLFAYICSVYFFAYRDLVRNMGLPLQERPFFGASFA